MTGFDVVIVGGGSAGCVLAARLSEDANRSVLLLEAGPDHGSVDALPDDLRSAHNAVVSHDWGYRSEPAGDRPPVPLPRARVVGGCSATNAMFAVRGAPADYDAWRDAGCDGWGWDDVLPAFRRLERDLDFGDDDWHGNEGPLPIRRYGHEELGRVHLAALAAAASLGHAIVPDHNAPAAVGAGAAPTNASNGIRVSTAMAYLWPASDRQNLVVRADAAVDRLVFERDRCVGVALVGGETIGADLVVLSSGAYGSPTLLLRSGIGRPEALQSLGLEVVADLPAVGQSLMDHPMIPLVWPADPEAAGGPIFQTFVSFAPDAAGSPTLQLLPGSAERSGRDQSRAAFFISAAVLKADSRGTVRLRSTDPTDPPFIDIGHLTTQVDLDRMRRAVAEAQRLVRDPAFSDIVRGREMMGVPDPDDPTFVAAARGAVQTYHHAVGTCAMGTDPSTSVVAPSGHVHGVAGLAVADASVMPHIPSANTNVPTIMVAERLASTL